MAHPPAAPPTPAGIVHVPIPGGDLETTNTDLAAALAALGIPPRQGNAVKQLQGDRGTRLCFFFQERSADGRFDTREMIKAWSDPTFIDRFPEHPMSYLMAGFRNRSSLLSYVKSGVPTYVQERGRKIAFVPLNTNDAGLAAVERELRRA